MSHSNDSQSLNHHFLSLFDFNSKPNHWYLVALYDMSFDHHHFNFLGTDLNSKPIHDHDHHMNHLRPRLLSWHLWRLIVGSSFSRLILRKSINSGSGLGVPKRIFLATLWTSGLLSMTIICWFVTGSDLDFALEFCYNTWFLLALY